MYIYIYVYIRQIDIDMSYTYMCHAQSMLCEVWQSQHSWGIPVLAILVPYI